MTWSLPQLCVRLSTPLTPSRHSDVLSQVTGLNDHPLGAQSAIWSNARISPSFSCACSSSCVEGKMRTSRDFKPPKCLNMSRIVQSSGSYRCHANKRRVPGFSRDWSSWICRYNHLLVWNATSPFVLSARNEAVRIDW
jgi:hypothetical protein